LPLTNLHTEPPRRRTKLISGKQRNDEAQRSSDLRRSSDASSRQPVKREGREDGLHKSPGTDVGEVAGRYEELQRQIAEQKEQLRLKQERKAKDTANRNLEVQMKAESKAQEEARQQDREAKAAKEAAKAKVAKAQEVAQKLKVKGQSEQQRKDEEESRKADEAKEDDEAKEAKAAKEARHRKDEEAKEETRRKADEERKEASRKEQARLEEIIAKRKAAEREAQEQAEREQREEEARLADEARVQAELEQERIKAAEVQRLLQEERDRAKAAEEAIRAKQEDRKKYLARLPRALHHALRGGSPVQPEHIVRPDGPKEQLDYLHSLEKHRQPIPLFRGSDIVPEETENDQLYIPGFMASVYLRHERLDTVREELGWRTLTMHRQARETLWARNGISHFLVKDHDWAFAPPEISQNCGIPVEIDLAGMRQVRWGKLFDEGKEQWLDMEEEQCLWVRLEDFIAATIGPAWLREVEIRTSAWTTLSKGKRGMPIRTPTFMDGKEV
jgi:hypothetical protein